MAFDQGSRGVDERSPTGLFLTNGAAAVTNRLRLLAKLPFFVGRCWTALCMEINRNITAFFWTLLFLAILLQLATSKPIPLHAALLYTSAVVATFWLYCHYASQPATRRFLTRQPTAALLLLPAACAVLTLALAGQGYVLAKVLLPVASAHEVLADALSVCFGLFILSAFITCLHYLFEKYQTSLAQEKELEVSLIRAFSRKTMQKG